MGGDQQDGVVFERFDFEPGFEVVAAPELPGDGDWRCPFVGYDRDGAAVADAPTTWGAPLFIEVTAAGGNRWVGAFAAGGLGGAVGVYATPNPDAVCVLNDGLAYLVDVTSPGAGATIAHDQVGQVLAHHGPDLLLLVRCIDIVAIGSNGVAWRSGRVAVDDLRVVSAAGGTIVCTLDNLGGRGTITLNAVNGQRSRG